MTAYTPESDDGVQLGGKACLSTGFWIPRHLVKNEAAIKTAATITTYTHTGAEVTYTLCEDVGDYLVVAKHLFDDWGEYLESWETPDIQFEKVDFDDQIKLRDDDQEAAWQDLSKADNGILNLGCGKGKTVLALKKIAEEKKPALVIVNLLGLVPQWADSCVKFLGMSVDDIGIVQGKTAEWDKPVVIAMIHTLSNIAEELPEEIRQRFGIIVWDEVHHLAAPVFLRTAKIFYGKRFGLSATPKREDGLEHVYYAHIGNIFHSNIRNQLESDILFKSLATKWRMDEETKSAVLDVAGQVNVPRVRRHLSKIESRNQIVMGDVLRFLREGRKVLVLTHPQKHPKELEVMATGTRGFEGYKIGSVSQKTKAAKRLEIIRESDVTFATFGTAREALDAPCLDTLLCITPFKAWGYLQQSKGRLERPEKGKQDPKVVIYEDVKVPTSKGLNKSLKAAIKDNGFTYREQRELSKFRFRKV